MPETNADNTRLYLDLVVGDLEQTTAEIEESVGYGLNHARRESSKDPLALRGATRRHELDIDMLPPVS